MAVSSLIQMITDENFEEKTKSGVILIDFYADWCGPCRMLAPILDQVATDMQGRAKVGKLDIDANQGIAARFQVASVPTMILFKDGKEVNRLVGLRDLDNVKKFVQSAL